MTEDERTAIMALGRSVLRLQREFAELTVRLDRLETASQLAPHTDPEGAPSGPCQTSPESSMDIVGTTILLPPRHREGRCACHPQMGRASRTRSRLRELEQKMQRVESILRVVAQNQPGSVRDRLRGL